MGVTKFYRMSFGSEMSTDQDCIGLDQDWSQFWPDQGWIGLQFFWKLAVQDWIGLRNFCCFNVITDYSENIKIFSCDPISQVC